MNNVKTKSPFQKAVKVDKRLAATRRHKSLIREYESALGGAGRLNVGEAHTILMLCSLIILAERQEDLLITNSPMYSADEHMRNVGKIKLITDDLDFPKKRRRSRSAPDLEDDDDDDPNAETLEEYLSRPEVIASAKRGIHVSEICGKDPDSDGKGPYVFKTRTRLNKEKSNGT